MFLIPPVALPLATHVAKSPEMRHEPAWCVTAADAGCTTRMGASRAADRAAARSMFLMHSHSDRAGFPWNRGDFVIRILFLLRVLPWFYKSAGAQVLSRWSPRRAVRPAGERPGWGRAPA